MRWFVEITRPGRDERLARLCLEAPHWQPALKEARRQRGEGQTLEGLSVEFLDDGCRAVDAAKRLCYVVSAAPDDEPLVGAGDRPQTDRPGRLAPPDPEAPPAPSDEAGPTRKRTFELASSRNVPPSASMPLGHFERSYGLLAPMRTELLEAFALERLAAVKDELADESDGKVVDIAVFAAPFSGKPDRPPLVTLRWCDWRRGKPQVKVLPYGAEEEQPATSEPPRRDTPKQGSMPAHSSPPPPKSSAPISLEGIESNPFLDPEPPVVARDSITAAPVVAVGESDSVSVSSGGSGKVPTDAVEQRKKALPKAAPIPMKTLASQPSPVQASPPKEKEIARVALKEAPAKDVVKTPAAAAVKDVGLGSRRPLGARKPLGQPAGSAAAKPQRTPSSPDAEAGPHGAQPTPAAAAAAPLAAGQPPTTQRPGQIAIRPKPAAAAESFDVSWSEPPPPPPSDPGAPVKPQPAAKTVFDGTSASGPSSRRELASRVGGSTLASRPSAGGKLSGGKASVAVEGSRERPGGLATRGAKGAKPTPEDNEPDKVPKSG